MPCNQTYKANGHLCYPCSEGFHKLSDCVNDNQMARCERCGLGYYQPNCNIALTCEKCSQYCPDKYMVQIKECSVVADRVCKCASETFWYKEGANDGFCRKYSLCEPGRGLLVPGSAESNTVCSNCIIGETFSNASSLDKCMKCTNCSLYWKSCTTTSDAVCSNGTDSTGTSIIVTTSSPSGNTITWLVPVISVILIVILSAVLIRYCRRGYNTNPETENGLTGAAAGVQCSDEQHGMLQDLTRELQNFDAEISTREGSDSERQDASNADTFDQNQRLNAVPIGKADESLSDAHYGTTSNAPLTPTGTFTSTSFDMDDMPAIHMTNGGNHAG